MGDGRVPAEMAETVGVVGIEKDARRRAPSGAVGRLAAHDDGARELPGHGAELPVHLLCQAVLDADPGDRPQRVQPIGGSLRVAGVTRWRGTPFDESLPPDQSLDDRDGLRDRYGGTATNVDRLSRLAVRRGGQQRGDDIADVGEVTSLASVAEDDDRRSLRDGIDEPVECHIRSLAGTVDAEKAERHDRQSERLPVDEPE